MNPIILYISLVVLMMYAGFGLFIFLGFYLVPKKRKTSDANHFISIIIPFRNEALRLPPLLQSLQKLNYTNIHYEIIFVDDHSEDKGCQIIEASGLNYIQCIRSTGNGKKAAIKCGVDHSKGDLIALTDADCMLPTEWLQNLKHAEAKMILGPVQLKPIKTWLHVFQEIEWAALQSISASTAFWNIPSMNNGANLAYQKGVFNEASWKPQTPSGDDIFMLEEMKRQKQPVDFNWSDEHMVTTGPAENLSELIQQKVRWASKTKFYKNKLNIGIGILSALMNAVVLLNCFYIPFSNNLIPVCIVIAKWMIDILVMIPYLLLVKRPYLILMHLILVIVYPIYFLFILMLSLRGKFIWKGRTYHA